MLEPHCSNVRIITPIFHGLFQHFSSYYIHVYMSPVKRICVFEHSVMANFNCACPAIQRGQGSGFLSEGSSWLTACTSEQRRFWRDCVELTSAFQNLTPAPEYLIQFLSYYFFLTKKAMYYVENCPDNYTSNTVFCERNVKVRKRKDGSKSIFKTWHYLFSCQGHGKHLKRCQSNIRKYTKKMYRSKIIVRLLKTFSEFK